MEVKHYLITLDVGPHMRMHGYLMCDEKRCVEVAIDQMITKAEELGLDPFGSIGLVTELSTGTEIVRKIVSEQCQEAKHLIETATDFHFSAGLWHTDGPDDSRMMELH